MDQDQRITWKNGTTALRRWSMAHIQTSLLHSRTSKKRKQLAWSLFSSTVTKKSDQYNTRSILFSGLVFSNWRPDYKIIWEWRSQRAKYADKVFFHLLHLNRTLLFNQLLLDVLSICSLYNFLFLYFCAKFIYTYMYMCMRLTYYLKCDIEIIK